MSHHPALIILLWMFLLHICLDPRNLLFTYFLELFYIRDGVRRKVFIFHHRFLDSKLWQFMALEMNFLPKKENYAKGSLEPGSVQFSCPVVSDPATPWTVAHQATLSITSSWSLLKFMAIESVMPSNHLILCYPLLLPSIFPSIRGFSSESALCIRWLKYCSFIFSISPSNEYSGLISFRMDWLDLLSLRPTWNRLPGTNKGVKSWCADLGFVDLFTMEDWFFHDRSIGVAGKAG